MSHNPRNPVQDTNCQCPESLGWLVPTAMVALGHRQGTSTGFLVGWSVCRVSGMWHLGTACGTLFQNSGSGTEGVAQ